MVNGLFLYSAFLIFKITQSTFTLHITLSHSHTFIHWWEELPCRVLTYSSGRRLTIHTHSHTVGRAIRSDLVLSILPKDTSTCRHGKSGIELPVFPLVGEPMYLLSRSCLKYLTQNGLAQNLKKYLHFPQRTNSKTFDDLVILFSLTAIIIISICPILWLMTQYKLTTFSWASVELCFQCYHPKMVN